MVANRVALIQPDNDCCACGSAFKQGDKGMCLVKIPEGEYDTMCMSCWATIMASSIIGLKGMPPDSRESLKRLFLDALDALDDFKRATGQVYLN